LVRQQCELGNKNAESMRRTELLSPNKKVSSIFLHPSCGRPTFHPSLTHWDGKHPQRFFPNYYPGLKKHVLRRLLEPGQYVSLAYTQRLQEAKLLASTGCTGDSYDNAMAESINGLYKAEVIHRQNWKNRSEVELATLTWGDWYNNRRLLGRLGHIPPVEAEKAYYASIGNGAMAA
ncbi:integrase core domain-containing protein, partial [Salmonella enterica]|uniref:integrase core domain-containing protein n=1 Tax=Salmonella enterica TaxID=28901 RepID=UPI003D3125A7